MFINTRKEARLAARLAHKHGFTVLDEASFYRRDTVNVFSPWSSDQHARDAESAIHAALRESRAGVARLRKNLSWTEGEQEMINFILANHPRRQTWLDQRGNSSESALVRWLIEQEYRKVKDSG